jgi:ATP-binding protein involved in chromosome partitioning
MGLFNRKKGAPEQSSGHGEETAAPEQETTGMGTSHVRHVIAIGSGKGGVGKSTVATNLAVAMQQAGQRVGVLDADIYGPSQPRLLGSMGTRAQGTSEAIEPVQQHGVRYMSVAALVGEDRPGIWRAPIANKIIQQMVDGVRWGELDTLLIDLPPGTGDVQLTLAQQVALSGAVIVTTPQQVALGIATKALEMFRQLNVPILGMIENMSGFLCDHCGETTDIFKQGGGREVAAEQDVPWLGAVPLDRAIMASGDDGMPVLLSEPESASARVFSDLALAVTANAEEAAAVAGEAPVDMAVADDGALQIQWPDGQTTSHQPYDLRLACGCAGCVDETTGHKTLDPSSVPLDIRVTRAGLVGRYAIALSFSDGHSSGLYTFERLRALDQSDGDRGAFPV